MFSRIGIAQLSLYLEARDFPGLLSTFKHFLKILGVIRDTLQNNLVLLAMGGVNICIYGLGLERYEKWLRNKCVLLNHSSDHSKIVWVSLILRRSPFKVWLDKGRLLVLVFLNLHFQIYKKMI